jgi:hypothetical protein
MIDVSKLGKILKATNRLNMPTEFNASLPIKIEVKKQLSPIRYLLQLGHKELETKSYKNLEIGGKYLGEVLQKESSINIKNLTKIPKIFDDIPEDIKTFMPEDSKYKEEILKHLANSNTKADFLFYTNLLLAFQKNIKHLIINEDGKKSLHQIKKEKKRVKFYSFFSNLGAISGEIFYDDIYYLNLMVEFQNSIHIIKKHLKELKNFEVTISQDSSTPLFEISEAGILNLKG